MHAGVGNEGGTHETTGTRRCEVVSRESVDGPPGCARGSLCGLHYYGTVLRIGCAVGNGARLGVSTERRAFKPCGSGSSKMVYVQARLIPRSLRNRSNERMETDTGVKCRLAERHDGGNRHGGRKLAGTRRLQHSSASRSVEDT